MNSNATLASAVVCLWFASPTLGQSLAIDWFTIDGGGAMASVGGSFEVSGTIGQPDADIMAGGGFELVGGFWGAAWPICYADCDQSTGAGVLDIFDFLCFQNSFVLGEPYACDCDPDPACDIFDFLCFQNAFVAGCP